MSILGEIVLNGIGACWDAIGYHIAKRILPIISFWRMRVEEENEEITKGQKWNEIRRDAHGVVVVNALVAATVTFLLMVSLIVAGFLLYERFIA